MTEYNPLDNGDCFNADAQPQWQNITTEDKIKAYDELQQVIDDARAKLIGEQ